jgi:hypothetical protein
MNMLSTVTSRMNSNGSIAISHPFRLYFYFTTYRIIITLFANPNGYGRSPRCWGEFLRSRSCCFVPKWLIKYYLTFCHVSTGILEDSEILFLGVITAC